MASSQSPPQCLLDELLAKGLPKDTAGFISKLIDIWPLPIALKREGNPTRFEHEATTLSHLVQTIQLELADGTTQNVIASLLALIGATRMLMDMPPYDD
jgi:hypothetical protein